MESADVVVIGAGIIGCSVAYYLSQTGLKVCILERDSVASGASGHGHGSMSTVGRDFERGPHYDLGLIGKNMYPQLVGEVQEETGIDSLFHERPGLSLAILEEEEAIFKEAMSWQMNYVDMKWIDPEDIHQIEPRITSKVIGGVLYSHSQVDAYRLSLGLVAAVEKRGGFLKIREAVGLKTKGDKVTGVLYQGGEIVCDNVVIAMGAWSGPVREWLDFPVPVKPLKGEVLHLRMNGDPPPIFIATARHGPIIPRKDGLLLCGSTGGVSMSGSDVTAKHGFDPKDMTEWSFDLHPTEDGRRTILEKVTEIMPDIADAYLVDHLAGVRPLSADRMPIMGSVPSRRGVYLATGHGTKGIHLAAVTGKVVSQLITVGKTDVPVAVETFSPSRFVS
jgi:glycine oxidase